ncbi:VWA domain-containing protein [Actinomycetospora endophytica]|uniref:VWA domain-containing protein n=1 Tax=Actinomycetospora endophytica TaxID=2291215 RepID=A0ABS8P652_9PSEU|nr:VWA domain-containing protein [Actinomycetospora endophytica]MCD2193609.1 VWA domain-containing protein [Actinomycetospora endophytica]
MSERGKLLPFYLVIDVSYSMDGPKLERANNILPAIVDTLAQNPIISDKVRFGMIDFSDDAQVRLPLCDPLDPHLVLPGLAPRGGTSYGAAFSMLRQAIAYDVAQLKADGFAVHRPAVFFISDGEPTDPERGWRSQFAALTHYDRASGQGFAMYPNVIPFGIDQANPRTLQTLIHPAAGSKPMRMFLADEGQDPAVAIKAIAEILISSVLASGGSLAGGGSGIVLPPEADLPGGIHSVAADEDFV